MNRIFSRFALLLPLVLIAGGVATAKGMPTARVRRGDLSLYVTARGTVCGHPAVQIRITPRAFSGSLHIREIVPPGTLVSPGQVLLECDDHDVRSALDNARFDLSVARRGLTSLERSQAVDSGADRAGLADKEQALRDAETRLDGFLKGEKPFAEQRDKLDDQAEVHGIENARDELSQLEQMYQQDELVTETEKIVLARARFNLAQREARHELARRQRAWNVRYHRLLKEQSLQRDVAQQKAALARARETFALAEESRTIAHEQARRALDAKVRRVQDLEHDLEALTVKAPCPGIVLHGRPGGAFGRRFRVGQALNTSESVLTLLDPKAYEISATLPASQVLRLHAGEKVRITPLVVGASVETGRVVSVAHFPASGKLALVIRADGDLPRALLGAAVTAEISVVDLTGVLLVPRTAVHESNGKSWCLVPSAKGPRKVAVTTGPEDGREIVITRGLAEGTRVLLSRARK